MDRVQFPDRTELGVPSNVYGNGGPVAKPIAEMAADVEILLEDLLHVFELQELEGALSEENVAKQLQNLDMKIARVVAQWVRLQEDIACLFRLRILISQLVQDFDCCLAVRHLDETRALRGVVDHLEAAGVLAARLTIELKNSTFDEATEGRPVLDIELVFGRPVLEVDLDLVFFVLHPTAGALRAVLHEGEVVVGSDDLERGGGLHEGGIVVGSDDLEHGGHDFGTKSKSDVQISATIHIDHSAFTTTFPRSARRTWAHQGAHAAGTPAARVGPTGRLTCQANVHVSLVAYRPPQDAVRPSPTGLGTQQAQGAHLPCKLAWQMALRVPKASRQRSRLGGPRDGLRTGLFSSQNFCFT